MVLRDARPRALHAGLLELPRRVRLPLQFVLSVARRSVPATPAGAAVTPDRRRSGRVSRLRRRSDASVPGRPRRRPGRPSTDRDRAQPRAAASRADVHGHKARAQHEPAEPALRSSLVTARGLGASAALDRAPRRHLRDRPRRQRLQLRQRGPAPTRSCFAPTCWPPAPRSARSTSISSGTADTSVPSFGSQMVGTSCVAKAGPHLSTGGNEETSGRCSLWVARSRWRRRSPSAT